jgi:hypothetical protein
MVEGPDGYWRLPKGPERLPMYSLTALAPG